MIFLKRYKRYIIEYTKPFNEYYSYQSTGYSPILHNINYGCIRETCRDNSHNLGSDWTYDGDNIYLNNYHTYILINEVKIDTSHDDDFEIEEKLTIFRILKRGINGHRELEKDRCWGYYQCVLYNIFQHVIRSEQDLINKEKQSYESHYCIYKNCKCPQHWEK